MHLKRRRSGPGAASRNAALPAVTRLCDGSYARVVAVQGDVKAAKRLAAMGLVPGAVIFKKTSSPFRGPVVLEKGATQFAIGYGMALRIVVQPLDRQEQARLP